MLRLRLHPDAAFEGVGASTWIGDDDAAQGEMFAAALEESFRRIKSSPMIYRCFEGEFRSIKVGKFSYSIIFRIRDVEIQVIAIMHQHRRPGYWKQRADQWDK